MNFKNYTPEMKALLISSLEDKITDYERKISDAKIMMNDIRGVTNPIENQKPIERKETQRQPRKPKDGGWFEKIQSVLQKTNEPLTSRGILDRIVAEFEDVPNNATSMGSLSPALNSYAEKDLLIKNYTKGSFATFELPKKNVINFQDVVNQ